MISVILTLLFTHRATEIYIIINKYGLAGRYITFEVIMGMFIYVIS